MDPPKLRLTHCVQPEDELQESIARLLWKLAPDDCWWTGHELRNAKSAIEGANRKRRGCKAGFPDLSVWWHARVFLFELKRVDGTPSKAQKLCHAALRGTGFDVHIARRPEDVIAVLTRAGMKLKGRIAA